MDAGSDRTLFRAYDAREFLETGSWERLHEILATGNGGVYGLCGPRGSGKSWLMHRAITEARALGGTGLWFPCPSGYDPEAFLSMLADTLASQVEEAKAPPRGGSRVSWLKPRRRAVRWRARRVVKRARRFRERTRFSVTSLKRSAQANLSVTRYSAKAGIGGNRSTDLAEREPTVASLVFDFRRFAEDAAKVFSPLVIAIDELDKIDSPETVRALLRDVKGIFEIPGVYFLLSVSDEAAAALRLGSLRGRDEFSSSFYTVLEMAPLDVPGTARLMTARGAGPDEEQARMLCLLAAGNWRETVRLADEWRTGPPGADTAALARRSLGTEAATLLRELARAVAPLTGQGAAVLERAWRALPASSFAADETFLELSRSAIGTHWELLNPGDEAGEFAEAWRRYLIRLFIAGRVLSRNPSPDNQRIADLRDLLVQSGFSADVARLLLRDRFGPDLDRTYTSP